jgi:hypothetical protein
MIIRFSKMLSEKIHTPNLPTAPTAENPYLDWHATLFRARRNQYIMVSNSKSLFSIFMHGAGITDFNHFFDRMCEMLKYVLCDIKADFIYQRIIAPNTGSICLAKAQDRRIIGSMNEQVFFAKTILYEEEISPFDLSFKVNEFILSTIKYATPKEAFWAMKTGTGNDQTIEAKPTQQPENNEPINPLPIQEKLKSAERHLKIWKPESEETEV